MLTCNSSKSRNTNFGIKIANIKHKNFEKELDKDAITEGYFTAKAAIKIASDLDNLLSKGKLKGPLHGIPIILKDNIDTGDKMNTTAGSRALINSKAIEDAFIV